jgi:hypothetical protein
MLSDLIEVEEGIFKPSADGGHSTQCCSLELFALEKGLSIFEKSDIVSRYDLDEMFCGRQLPEGYSEVVCIVESVEEVFVEGMDVLQAGEAVQDEGKLLSECFLRELDLSGVEI